MKIDGEGRMLCPRMRLFQATNEGDLHLRACSTWVDAR